MRGILRLTAAAVLLGALAWWAAGGAHAGWSKHSVAVQQVDEVTGIEFTTYEDRFVPGVEIPLVGAVAAAVLAGLSFLIRGRRDPSPAPPTAGPS